MAGARESCQGDGQRGKSYVTPAELLQEVEAGRQREVFGYRGAWWDRWRAGLRYLGELVGCFSQPGELELCSWLQRLCSHGSGSSRYRVPSRERKGGLVCVRGCVNAEAGLPWLCEAEGRQALMCGHHTPGRGWPESWLGTWRMEL